ncbi:MAG: 2'-5' RNA ligase family protein [Microbacteriaceae bacterium]|nr:2'-5' RNA ligase family protein [Microbacteriaceae bacterium]
MTAYQALYADHEVMANHWWWRPGWQVGTRFYTWHITQDEAPAAIELAERYQDALRPFPSLDPVPRKWLHMTMQGVGHVEDVPESAIERVIDSVANRLTDFAPISTTYQRAHIFREAIALPPANPEALAELRSAVRAGITDALGECPEPEEGFRPHVSVAYSNDDADAAPIRGALDLAQPGLVHADYSHISLIVIHRDNRMYEWETIRRLRLGEE